MVRVIYVVEGVDLRVNGDGCLVRRYARNLKTARKIERAVWGQVLGLASYGCVNVARLNKSEWRFVNPEWVEG